MTVAEMMDAIAEQLDEELTPVIENLQVENRFHPNPTPPALDIYPATPFTEVIAYGRGSRQYWFIVRARVSTAEHEGAQDLLLAMMDDATDESVELALRSVGSYAGAKRGDIQGPTEFGMFPDPGGAGWLLGCTWQVALIP